MASGAAGTLVAAACRVEFGAFYRVAELIANEGMIMSGAAIGECFGNYHHLIITGGVSSWDYDSVRQEGASLNEWAMRARDPIDLLIYKSIQERGLPIVTRENMAEIEFCYGGIIQLRSL